MADEDEVVVEIEGDGADPGGEIDPVAELKRQAEELKRDNEKRASAEAEANRRAAQERARADAATREVAQARTVVADSHLDTIVSGIAAAAAEAEAAERDYAAAAEAGDFRKQAEAQRRMARAESRATTLEGAKADLEARKSAGPQVEAPQRRVVGDSFEVDYLSHPDGQPRFTDRTAQWMREHRDWVTDPKKSAKLRGAHNFAEAEGYTPDTDDYFEYVEKMIGMRQDAPARNGERNGAGNGQTRTPRRTPPGVAPVNGGAGAHSSGAGDNGRNTVYLTKGEADRSTDGTIVWNYDDPSGKGRFKKGDPIGHQEMARRKQDMQKRGFYDRSYSGG